MEVKALKFQSLFDITVQETGILENTFAIAIANGLSITDDVRPGMLTIPDGVAVDIRTRDYFSARTVKPATAEETANRNGVFDTTFDNTFN